MIFTDIQKMFLFPLYSKIKRKEKRRKVPAGGANGSIVPFCLSLLSIYFFFSLFRLCFQNKPLLRFTWKMMEFFLHFCLPLYSTAERWINRPVYRRKASSKLHIVLVSISSSHSAMSEEKPPDGFSVIFNYLKCCFRRPANSDVSPPIFHAIWQPVRKESFNSSFFFNLEKEKRNHVFVCYQ